MLIIFFFYSLRYIDQVCCEQKFAVDIVLAHVRSCSIRCHSRKKETPARRAAAVTTERFRFLGRCNEKFTLSKGLVTWYNLTFAICCNVPDPNKSLL